MPEEVEVAVSPMEILSTKRTILAIDPGGTTGLSWYLPGRGDNGTDLYLTAIADSAEKVWECIVPNSVDQIIYEQFSAKIISKHGLHTVRVVGGIQALSTYHNIPCTARTPQSRIAFIDDAKAILKEIKGKSGAPTTPHERDALAHILSYQHEVKLYGAPISPRNRHGTFGQLEHYERSHA